MCRIAGIVQLNTIDSQNEVEGRLKGALSLLAHGGPDDEGIYQDQSSIALGHRRLSIIDISPQGHQPMLSKDEGVIITYNGELFNFLELRSELQTQGYSFQSNSDTEVIIAAYQHWGEEAFQRFNGMYAFGLYDKKQQQFYIVRDHAGIKPLYYFLNKDKLVFASEVKAFQTLAPELQEDPNWRVYFLLFGFLPQPYTTLKEVKALTKGQYLKLDIGIGSHEVRSHTEFHFSSEIISIDDAIAKTREVMEASVKRHLISDAPLGVYLSGGIDSSLLALLAAPHKSDPLQTLSATFAESAYDESPYQQLVSKKIGADHKNYRISKQDFFDNLDLVFSAMDQPTVDGVNSYFIARCAKENGLKAVLSGVGADELFGGYSNFKRMERIGKLLATSSTFPSAFNLFNQMRSFKYKKLSYLSLDNPLSIYLLFRGIYTFRDTAKILDIDEREIRNKLDSLMLPNDLLNIGKLNTVSYLESNLYMTGQLLKDTDYMSMQHAVEVRVPFLDKEVMQLAYQVSESTKFNPTQIKFLLVNAFKDILPKEIVNRPKQGFAFPFQLWLQAKKSELDQSYPEVASGLQKVSKGEFSWSRYWTLMVMARKGAKL